MPDELRQKLVPAVQNAALILRVLAERGQPLGATQIARETGMNVSSAFNILRTLSHEGLVTFDGVAKTYRIGMGLLEFVSPLLGASPAALIRPALMEIAQTHQVMIALWQITAKERIVLIDRIAAPRIVQASIARESRLPVFVGAVGRVYAAARGLDRATTRAGYESVHWQAEPGFEAYWADVQEARETRMAFDHGNLFRGLEIVASLARDADGVPRLGLSSITIAGQHDSENLVTVGRALAEAGLRIERCVFGPGPGPGDP
ncbi:IclR family transcriptional regulator [Rhodospira trueperi]|uniref:DNA-binding transcriptional regulator, IclR family n=1 Tax=Rhodospira trueperi TaxID=69960 RepID=A0A1G7GGA2_9PROT|nr:helix-turn-helix domain-containing protein [Rhodospira trueperi]SDE87157.1 DNA-binding transcriptional regulator, IclR family [Rhodospira trueperi]